MKAHTVVAISSVVLKGTVGLRATQFALERRGNRVWPVPTVLLAWHPGLGPSTRTVPPDFARHLAELSTHAAQVDAVLTGYYATAAEVEATAGFIDAVRRARPDALIAVDPVMGDDGGRYVPDAVAEAVITQLIPRADIATPNATELADIAGSTDLAAARALGIPALAITSAVMEDGRIGATLLAPDAVHIAEHDAIPQAPRGTGDLFGAVLLSAMLSGRPAPTALAEAAAATLAAVEASTTDELAFVAAQDAIATPPVDRVILRSV